MAEAGFEGIGTYVTRRQNKVVQHIATRTLLDLCERSARRPGAWVSRRWWEQDGLYLEGGEEEGSGGIGRRGGNKGGGGNAPGNNNGLGIRAGVQISNLIY